MDNETQRILSDLAPALARKVERAVPSTCFVARVDDRWLRGADASRPMRIMTADFSPNADGATVEALQEATVAALSTTGMKREPDEEEWKRVSFSEGDAWARVWPARAQLLDYLIPVLRVDLEQSGTWRDIADIAGDQQHFLDSLQPLELHEIRRETFVGLGDVLRGGNILSARIAATTRLIENLQATSFREDASGVWRRGPIRVAIRGDRATWQIASIG